MIQDGGSSINHEGFHEALVGSPGSQFLYEQDGPLNVVNDEVNWQNNLSSLQNKQTNKKQANKNKLFFITRWKCDQKSLFEVLAHISRELTQMKAQ